MNISENSTGSVPVPESGIYPECCPFDTSAYTGAPDSEPTPGRLEVPELIRDLDRILNEEGEPAAAEYLDKKYTQALGLGDWRAQLSIVSERLGLSRRLGDRQMGIGSVNEALELIRKHCLGRTISGATVLLNAATTMKCFGEAKKSIPVFEHVSRVYSDNLDPTDYRFAGLYNNMALSYSDIEDYTTAERFFRLALSIIRHSRHPENEEAVTWCNIAELYCRTNPEDERIDGCIEKAWAALNSPTLPRDGYHAFTVSKCLPTFDYFGYFLYVRELKNRLEEIGGVRTS